MKRARRTTARETAFRKVIRQIPRGKGYPLYHRRVAQLLRVAGEGLPWQRVLGSGGEIKLRGHIMIGDIVR